MNYQKTGLEVLKAVGGEDNVKVVTHCATRLRFELKDTTVADEKKVNAIDGVLKCIQSGGQFQVVIGPNVTIAYQAVSEVCGKKSAGTVKAEEEAEENRPKQSFGNRFIATITGIFTPLIPAITAAGMVKAVLAILKVTGLFAGLSGLVRYSFGSPGLATLPVFIGEDPANFIKALITAGMSFAITFTICMFLKLEDTQAPTESTSAKAGE